jgi:hypothetical protein
MQLNIFISAVIGIVSFLLVALFPHSSTYYKVPMGIIGKVYATSMLVLINSRMLLGSEETQTLSTVASILRFGTIPANPTDSAIEAEKGDLAVDTRAGKDHQEVQSLWQLKLSAE